MKISGNDYRSRLRTSSQSPVASSRANCNGVWPWCCQLTLRGSDTRDHGQNKNLHYESRNNSLAPVATNMCHVCRWLHQELQLQMSLNMSAKPIARSSINTIADDMFREKAGRFMPNRKYMRTIGHDHVRLELELSNRNRL